MSEPHGFFVMCVRVTIGSMRKKRRKKRKIVRSIIIGISSLAALVIISFAVPETSDSGEARMVRADAGANAEEIVESLYGEGYIRIPFHREILTLVGKLTKSIKAGTYELKVGMSAWETYLALTHPNQQWIRLEEGYRKEQMAEVLAKKLAWSADQKSEFENVHIKLKRKNMEGYYFPSYYLVGKTSTPSDVGEQMIGRLEDHIKSKYKEKDILNIDVVLAIASLIQREASGKGDMELISGIIWNRLFKGMNLDIDATLQYAKGNARNGWWPRVRASDKDIDSPYNTYEHAGLPPTPIANPGPAAIQAAYNPKKTKCLFYIHDKSKRIHCSETYKAHQALIKKYL